MCSSGEFTLLQHHPFLRHPGVGNLVRALGELNGLCHVVVAGCDIAYIKELVCIKKMHNKLPLLGPHLVFENLPSQIFVPLVCMYA